MRIGILTGGGDCPGLNAVIRAVVRLSTDRGHEMIAVRDGWKGLTEGIFAPLGRREVSGSPRRSSLRHARRMDRIPTSRRNLEAAALWQNGTRLASGVAPACRTLWWELAPFRRCGSVRPPQAA